MLSKNFSQSGLDPKVDLLAPKAVEDMRNGICSSCENKTSSNFCSKNLEYIPRFIELKISSCPLDFWTETTRRAEKAKS